MIVNGGVTCRASTLLRSASDSSEWPVRIEGIADKGSMVSGVDYSLDIVTLSKSFKRRTLQRGGYTTVKSAILGTASSCVRWLRGDRESTNARHVVTRAIDDLTIRVPRGSSLGIIGRNGSGKSTLLKLITGIYKPDKGSVSVRGRIAALIELGAGFHPDFSGRENLMLGGVLHGLSRQVLEERLDQIIEFAELAEVIDDPVRTYSSGMFMRLGFSLAVHTDPDILIIDEVLAVGDAAFTAKCKERIAQLRREGKTLLLVSHDLDAVERWCDEVVWLNRGKVADRGNPRRVIDHYREYIERGEEDELLRDEQSLSCPDPSLVHEGGGGERVPALEPVADGDTGAEDFAVSARWGSRELEIGVVEVCGTSGEAQRVFHPDDAFVVKIHFTGRDLSLITPSTVACGVGITRNDGVLVFGTNTAIERVTAPESLEAGVVEFCIPRLGLLEGTYRLDVALHRDDGYPYDYLQGAKQFVVRTSHARVGICDPSHSWRWMKGSTPLVGARSGSPDAKQGEPPESDRRWV